MLSATSHAEFHHARDFLTKPHAARAVDATRHFFSRNERSHRLVKDDAFSLVISTAAATVADRQVLKLAFAALIADRAVKRVVDQQELHHRFLRGNGFFGASPDLHARSHWSGAGRQSFGRLLDLDQAHPAIRRDAQFLVITKMRNVQTQGIGRMHDHAALDDRGGFAVDFEFNHE